MSTFESLVFRVGLLAPWLEFASGWQSTHLSLNRLRGILILLFHGGGVSILIQLFVTRRSKLIANTILIETLAQLVVTLLTIGNARLSLLLLINAPASMIKHKWLLLRLALLIGEHTDRSSPIPMLPNLH